MGDSLSVGALFILKNRHGPRSEVALHFAAVRLLEGSITVQTVFFGRDLLHLLLAVALVLQPTFVGRLSQNCST